MRMVGKVICKTVGIAGMSAVLYDAYATGKHHSHSHALEATADNFESVVAAQRTNTNGSHVANAMQNKVANLRMSNPIVPAIGKIKGFISGFASSLGDNIIPVSLASLALLGKNFWAKLGAWGLAGYGAYTILKEGFGIGKTSPVDE